MTERWKAFYNKKTGERYGAYTIRGEGSGEEKATIQLKAEEKGINPADIIVKIEERETKMTVLELNRDQLTQLKARYYDDKHPEGISWGELASADDLITDAEIIEAYTGHEFSPDDFTGGSEA